MIKITFVASDGERREVEIEEGETAREAALYNDVPGIDGDCGGVCACATCHVHVDPDWLTRLHPANDDEEAMLDTVPDLSETSRLSCQLIFTPELDGLAVRLSPAA